MLQVGLRLLSYNHTLSNCWRYCMAAPARRKVCKQKDTHNKPFVVCCVCRSFTPLLYYKPIYLSIFYWLAVLALSACSVTCLSRLLCERKLFVHVVVNMHEPVVWCRLLPCCRLALRKLPFFHNNVCRVYFYIVPIRVASRLNSSR